MINNDKNKQKTLCQRLVSSFLTLAYIIPVVAGDETHVDKPKKSTSSWIRTGLELLLCTGCVGGVIRELQNRNTINSKDKKISDLTHTLEEKSARLTTEQQQELTALKTLIDKVYNEQEYKKYLKITDENVEYKVAEILSLPENNTLKLTKENFKPTNETGIIQTFNSDISDKRLDYAENTNIPLYDWCLLTLADIELISKNNLVNKETQTKLETKVETLTSKNEQRAQFIRQHVSLKSVVLQHIAIFVNTMFNNKFSESFHTKLQSCKATQTITNLTAPQKINTYWKNCDLDMQNTVTKVPKLYLWEAILYMGFKEIVEHTSKTFLSKEIIGGFNEKFNDKNLTLSLLYQKLTPDYVSSNDVKDATELKLALLALKFVDELANNLSIFDIGDMNFSWSYWNMTQFTNLGLQEMWDKYDANVKQYKFEYNLLAKK